MIILGIILIVLGLLVFHPLLFIGIVVAIVGCLLYVFGGFGHRVGGRRGWY